ncbi:uncharacterized protein LOC131928792 [Physella acuta]|uniref:uncharacterized protein LOC131928792 n=1 Tax=Physella acuta TaxID=109671 RepID=UPI0027DD1388|nr:uncharacterized protein LOC131928792 [Physella acuta]
MELAALQLHHVLLQTYHESQAPGAAEDGASDSSGETITSDSGRGGSDEDISNSNMLSGNSMDDSRAGHNGSFQSNVSTFCQNANLKSSVKDPVRSSARKHVTFKDMERFRNSIRSQNGGAALSNNDLAVSTGAQPVQKGSVQGVNSGARGHQNPLSEMNIPVARDNSNVRIDNHNLGGYPGHAALKPRGVASPSYSDNQGRDSPKLVTFSTSAPLQPYQHFSHPRLPSYSGEDSIPSPMPKESNIEWRQHPQHDLTGSKLSINSAPAQPYLHTTSSRDRLPAPHHNFRSQSPQVFPAQPYNDTITRNTDQKQILSKSASKDNNWGTFQNLKNPHRDGLQLPHSNSFNSNINGNLLPPRLTSPLPVIPPREAVHLPDKYSSQPSLHGSDVSKYPTNTSNKMAFLTERFAMPSRDWTNESIATTEDGDDQRSTTTSGSYSIDHEDEYLAMEFKPKDIVV